MTKANELTAAETQDLTTLSAGSMDFLKGFGAGALDNLGASDLVIPRFKLIQNTSVKGTPGKFMTNLSEEEFDNLDVTILNITNFRTMFPTPYNAGDRPLCRSNNGKEKSDPNGVGSGDCARCQYAVWGRDTNGASRPPQCGAGYTILAIAEDGTPCLFSIKGASIKPAKSFFTRMKTRRTAPFAYRTIISSKQEVSTRGRYYTFNFEFGPIHTEAEIRSAAEQYLALMPVMNSDAAMDMGTDDETGGQNNSNSASNTFRDDLTSVSGAASGLDTDIPF